MRLVVCSSLLDVLQEAIAKRQLLSLYQGLGTKSIQSIISQFLYFYGYSFFRQLYLRWAKVKHMGTGANLAVGVVAGACTVLVTQVRLFCDTSMEVLRWFFGLNEKPLLLLSVQED